MPKGGCNLAVFLVLLSTILPAFIVDAFYVPLPSFYRQRKIASAKRMKQLSSRQTKHHWMQAETEARRDRFPLHLTRDENVSRRGMMNFLLNASIVPVVIAGTTADADDPDPLAEFGKSLKSSSSSGHSSGYPYSPSPLPSRFSSALDLTSNSKVSEALLNATISTEKKLDEVISEVAKSRRPQVGPLSHGY